MFMSSQIKYYIRNIERPAARKDDNSNDYDQDKYNRTFMYNIVNKLFARSFFAEHVTWYGNSKVGHKHKFRENVSIFKLTHAIILDFDPNITLCEVKRFYHQHNCRPAKKRSQTKEIRQCTGCIFHKKTTK